MTEEPTDEECQTIAMLTGYRFFPELRVHGRKTLRRVKQMDKDGTVFQYLDPVTLEVTFEYNYSGATFPPELEILYD